MGECYIGTVVLFGGTFAPAGWALCDGRLLSIAENEALFTILGTTYGGDGISTFAVPDLRGRAPVSSGQAPGRSNYNLGQVAGSTSVTLTSNQMPGHTHPITASATINSSVKTADATSPNNAFIGHPASASIFAAAPDDTTVLSSRATTTTVTIGAAGGSQPVTLQPPFVAINYCICTQGLFPTQN